MYEWLKAIHVAAAFAFFVAHGASAAVSLTIEGAREPARLRALLDLSAYAMGPATWVAALAMLASGIAMGFVASWWSYWWIWASIAIFVVVMGLMTPLGAYRLNAIRSALGVQLDRKKPAPEPVPPAELETLLGRYDPRPMAWLGGLGLAAIVLLMVLKPY